MPFERDVRRWMQRRRISPEDIDEVVQDAYCRLATLDTVDHIERPDAYFFSIVRNLLVRRLSRAKIVPIEVIAEIEALADHLSVSPEQEAGSRRDYARLMDLIARLPDRCRTILKMRKIEGYSQREIGMFLNVSESVVENETYRGVRAILAAWTQVESEFAERLSAFESGQERQR